MTDARPLAGVRVLELGHLIAGPFAGTLLGYFGAEVIKVEPPGGDPIRGWRGLENGTSLWWRSVGRNKKSVVIDLRKPRGAALVSELAAEADVVIENFKPGTLARLGVDLEAIRRDNPRLILAQVSGYGQSGPYAARPGFASVCEAFGGMRHLTGEPGRPPVRANLSLGDSLAGLFTALGVVMSLYQRRGDSTRPAAPVDVAIYEAVFSMLESTLPDMVHLGEVRQPSGTTISGVVPTGAYPCADGSFIVMGANSVKLFARLAAVIGHSEWADDPELASNASRVAHAERIDAAISAWTRSLSSVRAEAELAAAGVPCSRILDIAEIAKDPHYQARGMFEEAGGYTLPALAPRFGTGGDGGTTDWPGPALGAHTDEVLSSLLALTPADLSELRADAIIA